MILGQLWAFFAPALDPKAERKVRGLAAFAVALGAAGLSFGYWVLLPRALNWLTSYDSTHFVHLIRAARTTRSSSRCCSASCSPSSCRWSCSGSWQSACSAPGTLRKHRRVGYFVVAAIALALPGPDPMTTFLELLPMWALFEGSIWLTVLFERRHSAAASVRGAAAPAPDGDR